MNALRQFITSTEDTLTIQLPREYRKRKLEVIVMPMEDNNTPDGENQYLVRDRELLGKAFWESVALMRAEATKNGLTEEILDGILKNE